MCVYIYTVVKIEVVICLYFIQLTGRIILLNKLANMIM